MSRLSVNIGVIGAGSIAQDHLRSLRRIEAVRDLWVFDVDAPRAQRVADEAAATCARSRDELIDRCDIIWICTPPFCHLEDIRAVCDMRKDIFCEKPLAQSHESALAIERLVVQAKVRFFMGQSGRFSAPFVLMRRLIDQGVIGPPRYLFSTRIGRLDPATAPPWRIDDQLSGGAIMEMGVHEIDFISWIASARGDGSWRKVHALGDNALIGPRFQDSLTAIGALDGSINARLDINWSSARYLWERGVQDDDGRVLYFNDAQFNTLVLHSPGQLPREVHTGQTDWRNPATGENLSLRAQADAIVDAWLTDHEPPVTLQDGVRAVAVAHAMRRSASLDGAETVRRNDSPTLVA